MVESKLMEVMEILTGYDIRTDDLKAKTEDGVELIEAMLSWEDDKDGGRKLKGDEFTIGALKFLAEQITLPDELLAKYLANDGKPSEAIVEKANAELEQEEESEEDSEAELEKFLEMISEEYPELVEEVAEDEVIDALISADKEDDIEWGEHFIDVLLTMGIELTEPEAEEPEPEEEHVHDENCSHEVEEPEAPEEPNIGDDDEEDEDEDLEIPMVSPEEFAENVEELVVSELQEEHENNKQFQEPISPPSVARPGSIASMMEAIAMKEQVLANAVLEVEQVLDQAIELVAEYKESVITQTSAIREKLE